MDDINPSIEYQDKFRTPSNGNKKNNMENVHYYLKIIKYIHIININLFKNQIYINWMWLFSL